MAPGAIVLGDVTLGENASIWYNCVVRGDMAPVRIGSNTNVQDLTMVHVDENFPCYIGDRVGIGHRAIIHGCTVESDSLVGMGAILLNGVRIGTGSVVGAGAVVPENVEIPPGSLVMGVPGRVVRPVDPELRDRIRLTWERYIGQAERHKLGNFPVEIAHRISSL